MQRPRQADTKMEGFGHENVAAVQRGGRSAGSARLADSPRSPPGAAALLDRLERRWESPGEYGWVAGW